MTLIRRSARQPRSLPQVESPPPPAPSGKAAAGADASPVEASVGLVETRSHTFPALTLESGEVLAPVTLAYETYGELNPERTNAILICHAFSGDAHAAGWHPGDRRPGWWDSMIGPGKAFDTDLYFVICSNVIGGCQGSTGPSSPHPSTGQPYGADFPLVTIGDMVNAQALLLDHLGIDSLLSVAGGSMGGMQALQWLTAHPGRLRSAIPIATAARHSAQQIAFNEVGRQAIIKDPNWQKGHYYGGSPPAQGLSLARMVGHITFMSDQSMHQKFGRNIRASDESKFGIRFEVESYLHHKGNTFVDRFDANSYLYITHAMDAFDLAGNGPLYERFINLDASLLILAFKSDWLYPAYQSLEILTACKRARADATYCEVHSTYGHDAFLVEVEEQTHLISHFLRRVAQS